MSERYKRYSVEFKREALRRMESCRNVAALALELGIRRKYLYAWRAAFQERGEAGLRSRPEARPAEARRRLTPGADAAELMSLPERVAELERRLGVKQLEVEFFKRTFEHVRGALAQASGAGARKSTGTSTPGSRSKGRD
ncbi:MAG: transposase [Terriglobales bacterium]